MVPRALLEKEQREKAEGAPYFTGGSFLVLISSSPFFLLFQELYLDRILKCLLTADKFWRYA